MFGITIIHSKIMTQITLDISDTYVSFFMKLIKNFDFIKVRDKKKISLEDGLTPSQKKTWATVKKGFEDLKMIEQGKMKTTPARDFLQELQNEGYL
jgi:uncharacterized protein YpbB